VTTGIDIGTMTGPALYVSRNNGASFTGRSRVALRPQYALGISNSEVLADGSIVGLLGVNRDNATPFNIDRRPARTLVAVRSTPGGTALREGVRVSDWYLDPAKNDGSNIAALALDRTKGPYAGRLYAVWNDNRSGRSQVLLSWSDTKGDSWSVPIVVDDDLSKTDRNQTPDAINASVAVNQAGVVGVAWGDRREHPDNLGWRYRFAASFDGGDSFTSSVSVATAASSYDRPLEYPLLPISPTRSPGGRQPLTLRVSVMRFFYSAGDTVSMTVDDAGYFHPMWCDNRSGVSQLWTAAVGVTGSTLRNGLEPLADLDDVTDRVEAVVDAIKYDTAHNRGEVVVRLKNVSSGVIAGPVKVRVLSMAGQLGEPTLVREDGDSSGILSFGNDVIRPNELSKAQTLVFTIASHHQPVQGHDFRPVQLQFLNMRLKVFGSRTDTK
jgi:hypothetical protein